MMTYSCKSVLGPSSFKILKEGEDTDQLVRQVYNRSVHFSRVKQAVLHFLKQAPQSNQFLKRK